jgi:hypothetical protein
VTNYPPRGATPPALSRDQEKHKDWEQGWDDRPTSQSGAGGGSWSWSLQQSTAFKTELPHFAGEGADQTELQLKCNTAAACWKQQLWPPCMSWQSYFTSQFQLFLWTEGPNTTHKPVTWWTTSEFCLNVNTRIRHLRKNSRTFTNRLNFLWFLNLVLFILFLFLFYSCIINPIITILLSLFSPSLLSLLLLYYNPLFSLPTNFSAPSYPLFPLSLPPSPILPQTVTTLPLPPTYSPPAN